MVLPPGKSGLHVDCKRGEKIAHNYNRQHGNAGGDGERLAALEAEEIKNPGEELTFRNNIRIHDDAYKGEHRCNAERLEHGRYQGNSQYQEKTKLLPPVK